VPIQPQVPKPRRCASTPPRLIGVTEDEQVEIKEKVQLIKENPKYKALISLGKHGGAQFMKFVPYFQTIYDGSMVVKEAASIAWQYYQFID
jgi:hypothetical protein